MRRHGYLNLRGAALGLASVVWLGLAPQAARAARLAPRGVAAQVAGEPGAQDAERERAQARAGADRQRRRGDRAGAATLRELVDEAPTDAASRTLLALAERDAGAWSEARTQAERALRDALTAPRAVRAACARNLVAVLLDLGELDAASAVLIDAAEALDPARDARDAWVLGRVAWARGERGAATALLGGASADATAQWEHALARARCERRLGRLVAASKALVEADALAEAGEGREPDVLAELAALYFEADGELDHKQAAARAPGALYLKALELNKTHEAALVGMFELGRFNWNRQNRPAQAFLDDLLAAKPHSLEGLLAGASADLDDGKLPAARERLAQVRALAPRRRELRTLDAALAWVEHRREECGALLAALHAEDAADATPEREIARHLSELYRFAEAVPFARRATERAPEDWEAWLELGRALSNTGAESEGLAALRTSQERASGRQSAWRHNTIAVLERVSKSFVRESGAGELSFAWLPGAADVLRVYQIPFYERAREELAQRYGYTPGAVHIEVFERFQDFSVRSTGFEGFPALGVCFGPLVTAVAPQAPELRGRFSWARTSFHEFTHVIHLGLSHNRCPRWITEGLATWEEEHKDPAWTRNLRRELIDAHANGELIGVRDLNRAFRSNRILFGYYQGGLLCRMLIEERGFAPMIRLLEAFDGGADLDAALQRVFQLTPEELDRRFASYVAALIAPLEIEPRLSMGSVARLKLAAGTTRPSDPARARPWDEQWTSIALGYWQNGKAIDAQQALRRLDAQSAGAPRVLFLRAEMTLARGERDEARALYEQGLAAGGEDFRARMALGKLAVDAQDWTRAEQHFLAAEKAFPHYPEPELSAERSLAQVYATLERVDDQHATLARWLELNSEDYDTHVRIARWHAGKGRHAEAVKLFEEAGGIDPFRRSLHLDWGRALVALARHEEALREFRVTELVPAALDPEDPEPPSAEQRASWIGLQALELAALGRAEEAKAAALRALELDGDEASALLALERLGVQRS